MTPDEAGDHCARGLGIWDWASNDNGDPDVVIGCAGDVPTLEALAAVRILREQLPELKIRFINVVDLMRLQDDSEHPHGLSHRDFDTLFTIDKPVVFAYHGYPTLIHRLTYRRTNHANIHVRGYKEEGTTSTPFDMVMMNDMDRFHLVIDVIDHVPSLRSSAALLRQEMVDARAAARRYTRAVRRRHPVGPGLDLGRVDRLRRGPDRAVVGHQRGLQPGGRVGQELNPAGATVRHITGGHITVPTEKT